MLSYERNSSSPAMTATPQPDASAGRRSEVSAALAACLPSQAVLSAREDLLPYECDGLSAYRQTPLVAALPATVAEAAEVLRVARETGTPVVARGSGTGLSGGALPLADGILLSLGKFNRILAVDPLARVAHVQPGVRNAQITEAAAPLGLYYAPDPSSQIACSIGGNVAENSGGVHCLKYGLTVHNIQKVRALTMEGDDVEFGSDALDAPGYDLLAVMTGSEGLLALLTEVTVKLLPKPQTAQVVMASFMRRGGGGRGGGRRDRRGHRAGGPRDDGQARHGRRRGLRARRLRPRGRGDPAVRIRRHRPRRSPRRSPRSRR